MRIRRTHHAYWFLLPAIWWQPRAILFGGKIGWSLVFWWLHWGIEIAFPVGVNLPAGFERTLDALVGMVCEAYEEAHPHRTMWPAGQGSKPLWREPMEPEFDDSVYFIEVAEREASQRELDRRAWQKMTPEERKAKTAAERNTQGKES